jgi:hypothetical protein
LLIAYQIFIVVDVLTGMVPPVIVVPTLQLESWITQVLAHGSGIYLAPDFNTSISYAKGGANWGESKIKNIKCMAFCEILDDGSKGFKDAKPYYVISDENLIRTKYLIVF